MPRLIVVDQLANGTSSVTKDANVQPFWKMEDGHETSELWFLSQLPSKAGAPNAVQAKFDFNLVPGELRFGHSVLPPFARVEACAKAHGLNVDKTSFGRHNTTTIDFLVLTKGCLDLVTENDTVHLMPGDCIVQKTTVHAWINPGSEPAELVYVMLGVEVPPDFRPVSSASPVPLEVNYPPS